MEEKNKSKKIGNVYKTQERSITTVNPRPEAYFR